MAVQDSAGVHRASRRSSDEPRSEGIWGALARKAKSILQDDGAAEEGRAPGRSPLQKLGIPGDGARVGAPEGPQKPESPGIQKRIGAITSSLGYIGGTIGNALEVSKHQNSLFFNIFFCIFFMRPRLGAE